MAPVWSLPRHPAVALLALVALAAALPAAYAEILVLGELRTGEDQDWLVDAAAFESNDGHAYLLAVSISGTAQIINMTDPYNPVRTDGIHTHRARRLVVPEMWMCSARPTAASMRSLPATTSSILDVTDPTRPALVDVMLADAHGIASALELCVGYRDT